MNQCTCWNKAPTVPVFREDTKHLDDCPAKDSGQKVGVNPAGAMKTIEQINDAREKLRKRILTPGLNDCQKALVMGMLNALVWTADGPNATTMERMLYDEPLAAGKDPSAALERLDDVRSAFTCPKCGQPMAHSRLKGMFCTTCR